MRVLAAMSGGVDSAVAAARAVDAGPRRHRHPPRALAQPAVLPHRRPRLLHDRGRQRRAPGGRRHRHPVLRLGPQRALPRGRRRGLPATSTPPAARPTPACAATRRSSSPPCSTARSRSGFDAVVTGHYAQLRTGPDGLIEMHRAEDHGQGPVLRARRAHPGAARALAVPPRRHPEVRRSARRPPRRGLAVADEAGQPRHLLHQRRRHRRLAVGEARPTGLNRTGPIVVVVRRGARHPRGLVALHDRPAPRPADRAPRAATASRATCSTSSRSPAPSPSAPREELAVDGLSGIRPRWCGPRAGARARVHRPAARPRRRAPRRGPGRRRTRSR